MSLRSSSFIVRSASLVGTTSANAEKLTAIDSNKLENEKRDTSDDLFNIIFPIC